MRSVGTDVQRTWKGLLIENVAGVMERWVAQMAAWANRQKVENKKVKENTKVQLLNRRKKKKNKKKKMSQKSNKVESNSLF